MNMIKKLAGLMNKRSLVLTLSLVLALATATGGTLAWLVDTSAPVKNTFTYGDVDITLDETLTDEDGNPVDEEGNPIEDDEDPIRTDEGNEYEMLPGKEISKDPMVTVAAGSEDCWLLVEIEESANFDEFMTYAVDEKWTALEGVENVYYMEVTESEADQEFFVLKDNTVTVKSEVTKEQLNALNVGETPNYPTMSFTAYAVQKAGVATAADAWDIANSDDDTGAGE